MIQQAAVVGAGTMGPGIAQTLAQAGIATHLVDIDPAALDRAQQRIDRTLALMQGAGLLGAEAAATARQCLRYASDLKVAVRSADLVIEAVPEAVPVKGRVLAEIDALAPAHTIITSNTSSFPVHDLFPHVRPERFLVTHYANPPEIIPLVEVVCGPRTDPAAVSAVQAVIESTGKTAIVLSRYLPGFLVNRLQAAMFREVMYIWENGLASAEDLDLAVRASTGVRSMAVGPFETVDLAGLDTVQAALSVIFPLLCNDTQPAARLGELVAQGHLGVKSGKGIYDYGAAGGESLVGKRNERLMVVFRAWQAMQKGDRRHGSDAAAR